MSECPRLVCLHYLPSVPGRLSSGVCLDDGYNPCARFSDKHGCGCVEWVEAVRVEQMALDI